MAQQTINVGTSPNDGTGTPLRTAFQYTNSNFSELYTAVGPSGNNIVVPGSATITGDLTVATNRLSVSSTGVQIGTTTNKTTAFTGNGTGLTIGAALAPTIALWDTTNASYVASISQIDADMYMTNTAAGQIVFSTDNASRYTISSTGVSTWAVGGSTAMTLNSTGLGVGVTPGTKFDVGLSGTGTPRIRFTSASDNPILEFQRYSGVASDYYGERILTGGGFYFQTAPAAAVGSQTFTTRLTIDTSGNVGIGGNASATGIDTGVARLFVVAPNSNTGMAATFIADSVGRGLLVADQGKTNSFGVEVVAGLVKTGGFTSGTSVALFANAVERARVKSTGQVRFVPLAADPSGAEAGDVYYNSSSNKLKCYNGSTWNDLF